VHPVQHSLFDGEASPKVAPHGSTPTDPYFSLQWYLRNTGQNGGKVRLDLNVQAAWDQGITGKNVTTAIMDDGKLFANFNFNYTCKNIRG
jgi:proprotein convertase subtilisin/kexin type 2